MTREHVKYLLTIHKI